MIADGTELTTGRRKLHDIVAEYEAKRDAASSAHTAFAEAGTALKSAITVGGTWANENIDTGRISDRGLLDALLKSAWRHVYTAYHVDRLASANDKRSFEAMFASPPDFTAENVFAAFGDLMADPRKTILRGLAEVFVTLDPAYKSHEKVKIGVKGLPKRIILSNVSGYGSYGRDRLQNTLDALAAVRGLPAVSHGDVSDLMNDGEALLTERGVRLKRFANGNGHLYFEADTLLAINRALAEFYGDVLPDEAGEKPNAKRASTEVSKDLQYYPTPIAVVDHVMDVAYVRNGEKVLEPSCGCGRFLDAIRRVGAEGLGVEYDAGRALEARAKGHAVVVCNFLELPSAANYDHVIMNPPFYGLHYQKHIRHAMTFLKQGGVLTAVLPASANYDHGFVKEVKAQWRDLPVASFAESGTNVPTGIMKWVKK